MKTPEAGGVDHHLAPELTEVAGVDRRAALRTLLRGTCALAALGCGTDWRDAVVLPGPDPETAPDAGASPAVCGDAGPPGTPGEGWVEVPLSEHPALREPGGHGHVRVPSALLDVVVVHSADGCYRAVWRTCTHGDCAVDWDGALGVVECPCHGSRFGLDGQVVRGPASRPLAAFRTLRVGDSLFLLRPR
ncbi:Rieske 2Fe-2S domain-containing protein [Corallococcus sp. BB11-1]|uniref:QcrA and Rieske domain-containing protein n=1 Tax=Corallococcus sp. BB11-1 TaxID=2996783 RepID=UPI0022719E86|nr:Rieske 2Fe-2S domain-containing protein [Corallococcus sp. BB11-1]MCY1031842.1 Rieske 2Fe-2S domain-containing protein [Corallococcus sp. BB11-1]